MSKIIKNNKKGDKDKLFPKNKIHRKSGVLSFPYGR